MKHFIVGLMLLSCFGCITRRHGDKTESLDILDALIATDFTDVFGDNLEKDERAVLKALAFHQSLDKKETASPNWKLALEYGVILLSHAQNSQQIRQASELLDIAAKDSDSPSSAKIRAQWLRKLALRQLEFSQQLSSERALVGELKRKIEALSTIEQSLEERESKNEQ